MQQSLFGPDASPPPGRESPAEFLKGLNPAQREAVTTTEGPVLVIAGAGSGKTRTLVCRVAYLIGQGVTPERILLLTFTRKAAQEMLNRAGLLLGAGCHRVTGGTFHAVASSLLRRFGHLLGYSSNFTILDRPDSEGIVNLLKASLDRGEGDRRFPSKRLIVTILSQMVNKRQTLAEVLEERYGHLAEFAGAIEQIGQDYARFKREHNLMDYDDLLVNLRRVLSLPEAGREIAARFSHVMVDEYQDTNPVQAEIVRLIAAPHRNVMVVGDDAQSIYSFRGADFRNIMDFPALYPEARLIRLEENYRSTQPILSLTNAIIERAAERYAKKLFSSIDGGKKPLVYAARNESDQAVYVADNIAELIKDGTPPDQIAVLFRAGFHSYKLELELTGRQLAFEKRGGLKLTESAHIKDFVSLLRVIFNPKDNLAWNRILLFIDKVGPKTAQAMLAAIRASDDPLAALAAYPAGKGWRQGLSELVAALTRIREQETPLAQFKAARRYYQPVFERLYLDDHPTRVYDLEQLQEIVAGYQTVAEFLNDTALEPPETGGDPHSAGGDGRLVLSTVHSAKGLEWDYVFIIHLVEGKFPSALAERREEIEEERRLLYVAATRARRGLYLVYPREIAQSGRFGEPTLISRFLEEMPPGFTISVGGHLAAPRVFSPRTAAGRKQLFSRSDLTGSRVRHPFFGEGRVTGMSGPRVALVFFDRHGSKSIHLDYAQMEVIGP